MPPKCKFTKQEILAAALAITREEGPQGVTARRVGEKLQSSPKVIFSAFPSMEELQRGVRQEARRQYEGFLRESMATGDHPPYKASGMAYIRFAAQERELFKLIFMRDRTQETGDENQEGMAPLLDLIQENTGLSREEAYLFHLEMWVFVHGIAVTVATGYVNWDEAMVSRMLTDCYQGLRKEYLSRKKEET
jgi:AcrR family transcriptional regulator